MYWCCTAVVERPKKLWVLRTTPKAALNLPPMYLAVESIAAKSVSSLAGLSTLFQFFSLFGANCSQILLQPILPTKWMSPFSTTSTGVYGIWKHDPNIVTVVFWLAELCQRWLVILYSSSCYSLCHSLLTIPKTFLLKTFHTNSLDIVIVVVADSKVNKVIYNFNVTAVHSDVRAKSRMRWVFV